MPILIIKRNDKANIIRNRKKLLYSFLVLFFKSACLQAGGKLPEPSNEQESQEFATFMKTHETSWPGGKQL